MFQFLEIISSPSSAQGLPVDSTIVLKEGWVSHEAINFGIERENTTH